MTRADSLIELGSGTSDKTRVLLDAMRDAGTLRRYTPIDVSEEMLRESAGAIASEYPAIDVEGIVGDFRLHLDALPASRRRLVAFLGSTIGNLVPAERERFFFDLNSMLTYADWLLLGVDLVKDRRLLLAAYDDAAGITAAFNRNALSVINTELNANFEPAAFAHEAIWDEDHRWIEMRLRSTIDQQVSIGALGAVVPFEAGEAICTEISAKFTLDVVGDELYRAGFVTEKAWEGDGRFALVLARPYC